MHMYIKDENEAVWTVGFYVPAQNPNINPLNRWHAVKSFSNEETAAAYVNYLNGGIGDFPKADFR